jgi:hypothetical protein
VNPYKTGNVAMANASGSVGDFVYTLGTGSTTYTLLGNMNSGTFTAN